MKNLTKLMVASSLLLCSCAGFFDKDNTPKPFPLVNFKPETTIHPLWMTHTNAGMGKEYLKLVPALHDQTLFTADKNGLVTATDITTGKTRWRHSVGVTVSGGPAVSDSLVLVGTKSGTLFALDQTDGHLVWNNTTTSAIFAAPAAKYGFVAVKSIDGTLTAFSESDGHLLWHYKQTEPALILRGGSAPEISHDAVIAGFANGILTKLTLQGGNLLWQNTVGIPEGSFAIQRMVDIDADPKLDGNTVYAASYQGRLAAFDYASGQSVWTHELSSYTGLTVDENQVYVSDANSHILAFNKSKGTLNWQQPVLQSRIITGPVIMGPYIVVGDAEGYLHWVSKIDGHMIARIKVNKSGILVPPVVKDMTLYVLTKDGHLAAYRTV